MSFCVRRILQIILLAAKKNPGEYPIYFYKRHHKKIV